MNKIKENFFSARNSIFCYHSTIYYPATILFYNKGRKQVKIKDLRMLKMYQQRMTRKVSKGRKVVGNRGSVDKANTFVDD